MRAAIAIFTVLSLGCAACLPARAERFSFVALGDMPYRPPEDYARFDRLITRINSLKPAFSIHIGDIKSGSTPCSDESFQKVLSQFQTFEQPLVYTPGDNEWTDCHRAKAGGYDPVERLQRLRQIFFAKPNHSLGKSTLSVKSQADDGGKHAAYVENTRFLHKGVMFVQVHVVGSNNGFLPNNLKAAHEFFARDAANLAWLDAGFAAAKAAAAKAVVISMHANMYGIENEWPGMPWESAFIRTIKAITRGAKSVRVPMLVVYGDTHRFEILPFQGTNLKAVPNVLRMQVMGSRQVGAVEVMVDTDTAGVFGFRPLVVAENRK